MAAVEALKQFPIVNATIDTEAGTVTYADGEHIGLAVDTEKGLLVPVIKDAGDLNLTGLAKKIADLAARTRASKVTPDELSGGTFTITNYGSAGTLFDTPIINQPQAAILGTGALVKRPVVIEDRFGNESIAVRHMMYLSLSYDHRLIDGAVAASSSPRSRSGWRTATSGASSASEPPDPSTTGAPSRGVAPSPCPGAVPTLPHPSHPGLSTISGSRGV